MASGKVNKSLPSNFVLGTVTSGTLTANSDTILYVADNDFYQMAKPCIFFSLQSNTGYNDRYLEVIGWSLDIINYGFSVKVRNHSSADISLSSNRCLRYMAFDFDT